MHCSVWSEGKAQTRDAIISVHPPPTTCQWCLFFQLTLTATARTLSHEAGLAAQPRSRPRSRQAR